MLNNYGKAAISPADVRNKFAKAKESISDEKMDSGQAAYLLNLYKCSATNTLINIHFYHNLLELDNFLVNELKCVFFFLD